LKVHGNVMASNKLSVLSGMDKQLVEDARARRLASGAPTEAPAAAASPHEASAPAVFAALAQRLAEGALKPELTQLLQFRLREPQASWLVDFTVSPAQVREGESDQAAAVFTLNDQDLKTLAQGGGDLRGLYQRGALRVDGDARLAPELTFLSGLLCRPISERGHQHETACKCDRRGHDPVRQTRQQPGLPRNGPRSRPTGPQGRRHSLCRCRTGVRRL